ncbi:D-alanine--poly(phosphoribitol) ligase subunit DltA [Eggerthella guodeyinii]|uniref:Amino acid adenylation domain-containing protein n=1 Tax=Eggerthella guodeyinii TaxID=2690837 RepID=A0A6N7RJZ0_9ACTN|nr:D-alanine--poly(phosphoribitol) ligase subunit DltA [Eggerthella guodeyinii]MRX81281.1 amino acid adenylation domain-containing protein [Eggerthella guodeyinii]
MTRENEFVCAVERQVRAHPEAPAHRASNGRTTTYGELWEASDRIAAALAARTDGRQPVVVLGHKSALMATAFLGCLKSGHAFVPVDVEMPPARLADILSQLGDAPVVTTVPVPAALAASLPAGAALDARAAVAASDLGPAPDRGRWVTGEQTQYLIFTSGSTGRPKGIEVSARNVARFMDWVRTFPVIGEGGRVFLDQPPYSFDLSEYEVVGALSTGGCLHAVEREETEDLRALFADLRASGVEVWTSTPSFADLCLVDRSFDERLLPDVRLFLFCGEALRRSTAAALRERFPRAHIANTYGPTESTVAVTYVEIGDAELAGERPLPVGAARLGTELRIVDPETGAPCEAGRTGEIVIVGDTVAKGYFRNPEKTAAAFFDATLADGSPARAYRTGDAGHLDESGMLYCDGRFDSLVKVNGFRIELEDVEENLGALPLVKQAAVVPVRRRERVAYLKACVVLRDRPAGTDFEIARLIKARLAERVPGYMVPRAVTLVGELPLTCNGKVDRKALAEA